MNFLDPVLVLNRAQLVWAVLQFPVTTEVRETAPVDGLVRPMWYSSSSQKDAPRLLKQKKIDHTRIFAPAQALKLGETALHKGGIFLSTTQAAAMRTICTSFFY